MIYFSSIILNRVECNCFVCSNRLWIWNFLSYFRCQIEKSEVHKLSLTPAAYLPLHHRLSSSGIIMHGRCQHNPRHLKNRTTHKGCARNCCGFINNISNTRTHEKVLMGLVWLYNKLTFLSHSHTRHIVSLRCYVKATAVALDCMKFIINRSVQLIWNLMPTLDCVHGHNYNTRPRYRCKLYRMTIAFSRSLFVCCCFLLTN